MKPQTQWLICIIGLSAFIGSPAVAQTYRLEKFFNGTPPYDGDSLNSARNPIGDMEAFIYREAKPIITIEFEAEDEAPDKTPAETPAEPQNQTPAETPAEPQNQTPAETPDDSNQEPKREIIYEAEPTNPESK
ncbi:hypothetical protein [Coleofasciculus sp. H7-2]|uniref:hypothetical protein n=1 Tax=Coleofasciculus sp. H7-2 TaxID=3351545 RepID=UPI00366B0C71